MIYNYYKGQHNIISILSTPGSGIYTSPFQSTKASTCGVDNVSINSYTSRIVHHSSVKGF